MAQATVDDGIENLQSFCTLLGETRGALARDTEVLEARGAGLERIETEVRERAEHLAERLETALADVTGAEGDAVGETERLADSAHGLGQARLGEAGDEIEGEESAFEARLGQDRSDLDRGFIDLEGGFGTLAGVLEGLEAELAEGGDEARGALEALQQAAAEVVQRAEEDRAEALSALEGTEEQLNRAQAQEWEPQMAEHVVLWTSELPQALDDRCTAVGDPLAALYDAWEQEAVAEGDELSQAAAGLLQEATAAIAEVAMPSLAESAEETTRDGLLALCRELDELLSPLAEGEPAAEAAAALVGDLVVMRQVVGEIDRLLNAMQA